MIGKKKMNRRDSIPFEQDFVHFLSKEYRGHNSGKPLSPKVISDTLGRIRRVEFVLNIQISNYTENLERFYTLSEMIKSADSQLRPAPTKIKYGYGRYIYAVRLYYKFVASKLNKKSSTSNDKRFNW